MMIFHLRLYILVIIFVFIMYVIRFFITFISNLVDSLQALQIQFSLTCIEEDVDDIYEDISNL